MTAPTPASEPLPAVAIGPHATGANACQPAYRPMDWWSPCSGCRTGFRSRFRWWAKRRRVWHEFIRHQSVRILPEPERRVHRDRA